MMTDNMRELLSAAMDGEASDFELRRLLKAMETDPELAEDWARFHAARTVVRQEQAVFCDIDLSAAVMASLKEGTDKPLDLPQAAHARWKWLSGSAVAASVAALVFVAWQGTVQSPSGESSLAGAASTPAQGRIDIGGNLGSAEVASQRLNQYLIRHSENSARTSPQGMMNYTRIVIQPTQYRFQQQAPAREASR